VNGFGKVSVPYQVLHLKVFQSHDVVRHHHAPCQFGGKVFTLTLNLQMATRNSYSRLAAVVGAFLFLGELSLRSLQLFLCFAQKLRTGNGGAFVVGIEGLESHIQSHSLTGEFGRFRSVNVNTELNEEHIRTPDNSHAFDLILVVGTQILGTQDLHLADTNTIGEGDAFAVSREFPSGGFVLHGAVVLLEFGFAQTLPALSGLR